MGFLLDLIWTSTVRFTLLVKKARASTVRITLFVKNESFNSSHHTVREKMRASTVRFTLFVKKTRALKKARRMPALADHTVTCMELKKGVKKVV